MKKANKNRIKHRDLQVIGMIGKARTFVDHKAKAKSDKVGRKAKSRQKYLDRL